MAATYKPIWGDTETMPMFRLVENDDAGAIVIVMEDPMVTLAGFIDFVRGTVVEAGPGPPPAELVATLLYATVCVVSIALQVVLIIPECEMGLTVLMVLPVLVEIFPAERVVRKKT